MSEIKLVHGDCLTEMNKIEPGSIDLILCDLPYGTTQNKWDVIIPLDKLWVHYKRILKYRGAIVLFAQTPFDKILGCSNIDWLKYEWIWEKERGTGFLNAGKMPLKNHENILIFYPELPKYNPQKTKGKCYSTKKGTKSSNYGNFIGKDTINNGDRHPVSVLKFSREKCKAHPTQKPVELMEYLIKTYTNEGDLVLDNCMGSSTTGIACLNTGRNFIGIEKEEIYFQLAESRITAHSEYQKSLKSEYIPPIVKLYKERYDGSATIPCAILEKLKQYFSVELVNNFYSIK